MPDGLHDVDEQEGHALDAGAPELGLPRLEQRTLFGVRWNELWARPIGDVRAALGVGPVIDAARPELAAAA